MEKKYYRAAKKVHRYQYPDLNEEEIAFCDFKFELRNQGGLKHHVFENKDFYITSAGQWLVAPVRFTNKEDKSGHYNDWHSDFWRGRGTTTLGRAKPLIQNYVRHNVLQGSGQPLALLLSQRVLRREVNHTTCLIVHKAANNTLQAVLKDSNKIKRCTATLFAREICETLGINKLLVVGRLPGQHKPEEGSCLKEAFKFVGRVLDGHYPNSLYSASDEFKFMYDIKAKRVVR